MCGLTPLLDRCFTKLSLCVVFPQRSPPSKSIKAPLDTLVDIARPLAAMILMQALKQWQWPARREPDHCLTAAATGTLSFSS